jgi:hypothetical protein
MGDVQSSEVEDPHADDVMDEDTSSHNKRQEFTIELAIYDLSFGMATTLLAGAKIDIIPHS